MEGRGREVITQILYSFVAPHENQYPVAPLAPLPSKGMMIVSAAVTSISIAKTLHTGQFAIRERGNDPHCFAGSDGGGGRGPVCGSVWISMD